MEYGRVVDTKAGHDDASKCLSLVKVVSEKFKTQCDRRQLLENSSGWRHAVTCSREKSAGRDVTENTYRLKKV